MQRLGPEKDALRFFLFFVIKLEKYSVGVFICVNQSTIQLAQGGREGKKKDGGGRAPSTDWILRAGYVTSLGVLVKHSKQRGKCLKGSLCCWTT